MKKVEAYRVEIPIVATDEYSSELDKAGKAIDNTKKKAKDSAKAQDNLAKSSKDVAKAQDGVAKSTKEASKGMGEVGKSAGQADKQVGRATKTFQSFGNKVKSLQRAKATVELAVKDNATRVMDRVRGTWESFKRNPITRLTVTAVDRAMRILRGIKNTVLSIPTMITIGLSYIGVKSLGEATVGAAMNWEQYEVSMEHWLDGNTKKAKELTKWMGEFADITPFSTPELFPALTTAVSMSDKDIDKSKKLLKVATDMAALVVDKTPEDAMQALFGAKMGNTTMMKAYGQTDGVDEIKKMGGFDKYVDKVAEQFAGGAEKLSKTAAGVLATLRGYRGSFMRSIGTGFLEPMKPRLDAINQWLENNQEKWGRWKDVAMGHGKDLSESIFSTLEKGFGHVQSKYLENPEFMNLDLKGKIKFISGDIGGYLNETVKPKLTEWWDETGSGVAVEIGKSIGSGIVEGIKLGIQAGGKLLTSSWEDLFTSFKETGFSKETGKSALGALATTAGAAYLGKKLIYNPGRSVYRGGKKAKDWVDGGHDKRQNRRDKRGDKWQRSNDKRIEKGLARGDKARSKRERKQTNKKIAWDRKTSAEQNRKGPAPKSAQYPKLPKWLKGGGGKSGIAGSIPFLRTGLAAMSLGGASEEEMPGIIGSILGGLTGAKGGAMAGAAIGSVVPGVGTAIGAGVGGLVGGISGSVGGEWIGEHWETIKSKATETVDWIGVKFSEAKETASNTLLNGEWWSDKWEGVKATASNTLFSGEWWGEQAGYVWGTLENTLFSGEWWLSKWDGVKGWTAEKWSEWGEIYDDAKIKIDETIFSGEWWLDKWDGVKGWTSSKWAEFGDIWTGARDAISSTLFSSEWWSGKWGQVKTWASSAWADITSGFQVGRSNAGGGKGGGNSGAGGGGGGVTAWARGGVATKPHLGLVAEAGVPEAMIPWDGSNRSKAIWQQTGEALGMFDGGSTSGGSGGINASSSVAAVAEAGSTMINIGDINVPGGTSLTAEEILNMIAPALYEKIVAALAKR